MPIQFVRIFSVLEERLERMGIKMLQMRYIPQSKDAQLSPAFGQHVSNSLAITGR